jgi:hypothetical protein
MDLNGGNQFVPPMTQQLKELLNELDVDYLRQVKKGIVLREM